MDQRYSELRRNTIIIAISNICSKAIAFILAPLYSFYLTTSQYGTMDLVTTTVSLLTPIICLDIYEATFRYSNDDNNSESKLLTSSFMMLIPSIILFGAALFYYLMHRDYYTFFFTSMYLMLNVICSVLEQYVRGVRRMRTFALAGIVNSVFLLLFNYILMIHFRLEFKGWIISFVAAKLCEALYLLSATRIWKHLRISGIDQNLVKNMLRYCIPLLPTTTMWWVMNASDRYMLTFFVGVSATGIYSVANKIPSILSVFERIFYQSWQTSSIQSKNEKDYEKFYSDIFNSYLSIISIGILAVMIISKYFIKYLFEKNYYTAWYCVAPLLLAVLVHSLSGNLGTIYVTFKETKGALYTSFWGAVSNIVLNAVCIPLFGMVAAAYTTLTGYIVTLIVRWIDTKKYLQIRLDAHKIAFYLTILIVSSALYYVEDLWALVLRCLILLLAIIFERRTIIHLLLKR